eukprot:g3259.t1
MDISEKFSNGDNNDAQAQQEREALKHELRKSLLIEVGKIVDHERTTESGCFEVFDDEKLQVDKSVVHALTECLFQHAGTMAKDMFAFAKHAKRVNINQDDVKLLFRRREDLLNKIEKVVEPKKNKIKKVTTNNTTITSGIDSDNNKVSVFDTNEDEDELFF